jgi:hypothetical protein
VSDIFKEDSTPCWLGSRVGRLGIRHIQFTSQALFVVGDIPQRLSTVGQDHMTIYETCHTGLR